MSRRLSVSLRKDFREREDAGGYTAFSAVVEYVGAGSWNIVWPAHTDAARALFASRVAGEDVSRWGIVVREEGSPEVVFSGPVLTATRSQGTAQGFARDSVTAYGMTDTGILAGYLAFMTPGADVSTTAATIATAYWTRSSLPAETILLDLIRANVGSDALARREIGALVVPATLGRGNTMARKLRFTDLLEAAKSIERGGNVGVRLVQGGRDELLVEPIAPVPRPGLIWSVEAGTLSGVAWTWSAAEATDVIAGGREELTDRTFVRASAVAPSGGFGFRRERFSAQTNVEDGADLAAAAVERLSEGVASDGLTVDPTESLLWRYGVDYRLGDLITVAIDGETVTDKLRSIRINHSDPSVPDWSPQIGEWDPARQKTVARRIARSLAQQVRA